MRRVCLSGGRAHRTDRNTKRLTTSYGAGYNFEAGRLSLAEFIPDWLDPFRIRAAAFASLDIADLTLALLSDHDRFERVQALLETLAA